MFSAQRSSQASSLYEFVRLSVLRPWRQFIGE